MEDFYHDKIHTKSNTVSGIFRQQLINPYHNPYHS